MTIGVLSAIMTEVDVETWSARYDEHYDDELQKIEETLHEALTEQQYITQEQLAAVIRWKLNGQPGRRDTNIERMNAVPDEFVRQVSTAALTVDDPVLQLKTLNSIPGIGGATATVLLMFFDPENYAVGDRYIMDVLFDEDRPMRISDYPKIRQELRERNPDGFDLRTVEKAYYEWYRTEHDVGRW